MRRADVNRNKRSRAKFAHDPIVSRIAHEMPVFKFVPMHWLSEYWEIDVRKWVRAQGLEKKKAFGFESKFVDGHPCLVVLGPGCHPSWSKVTNEMVVEDKEEFAELMERSTAKDERARRWLSAMDPEPEPEAPPPPPYDPDDFDSDDDDDDDDGAWCVVLSLIHI